MDELTACCDNVLDGYLDDAMAGGSASQDLLQDLSSSALEGGSDPDGLRHSQHTDTARSGSHHGASAAVGDGAEQPEPDFEQDTGNRTWKRGSLKRNNLKKSIAKVSGTVPSARSRAAEDRSAMIYALASEWLQATEDELAGTIAAEHAHAIREDWQTRVRQLSAFQQKRVHLKVDKLTTVWLADPLLPRRLDQPWLNAISNMRFVRSERNPCAFAACLQYC